MIGRETIEKWNRKMGLVENLSYGNPVSIMLSKGAVNEGLIRTYPIEKARQYLISLYDFDESQVELFGNNGVEKLRIILPRRKEMIVKVKKALDLCGYFCSVEDDYPYIEGWTYLNFEPKNQGDVNVYVRNMKRIYHVTHEKNMKKIMQIGLTPKFRKPLFSYPERIYLFVEDTSPDEIYSLTKQFSEVKGEEGKHCFIMIDVAKIPENVNFFLDPNYEFGIYTKENIPPTAFFEVLSDKFGTVFARRTDV